MDLIALDREGAGGTSENRKGARNLAFPDDDTIDRPALRFITGGRWGGDYSVWPLIFGH